MGGAGRGKVEAPRHEGVGPRGRVAGSGACDRRDRTPACPPCAPLQVPHRLLTLTLLPGVELCLLCGPRPPLSQLDPQVNSGRVPLSPYYTLYPRAPAFPRHPALLSALCFALALGQPRPFLRPRPSRIAPQSPSPGPLSLRPSFQASLALATPPPTAPYHPVGSQLPRSYAPLP